MNNEHITLRRQMQRQLGQPVSAAAWEFAMKLGFVEEALDPECEGGPAGLLDFLRDLLSLNGPLRPRVRGSGHIAAWSSEDLTARIAAVSRLVAEEAAGDAEILDFRHRVLGRDKPMSAAEAEAYLDLPEARQPRSGASVILEPAGVLKYQNRHVGHDIHVGTGSPLDDLRKLSEGLAESYPWQPAQAAAFVLEGLVPLATPFMLHLPQTWHETRSRRAKLVMEVDLWMPASAVLRAYREVQRQVLPGHHRPVSRRAVDLVQFVLQHRPATWPRLLDFWNSEHPTSRYSDYRHMRFAFERARRSLLVPTYRLYSGEAGYSRRKARPRQASSRLPSGAPHAPALAHHSRRGPG